VDYVGFRKDSTKFNQYLNLLAKNPPNDEWSKEEQLAYWINVFNAYTISLVAKHFPVKIIKDIRRGILFINSVWDIKFIKIGKAIYDLNNIEHSILRKRFDEPRIHFVINCASCSCPRLRNEAYRGETLNNQLTEVAELFLADKTKNVISPDKIVISKVFNWFGGDFKKKGSLIDFLNLYSKVKN